MEQLNKVRFEKYINKYNLSGTCEVVVLKSTGNTLQVSATSEDNNLLCEVHGSDLQFPIGEFAIYETQKLKSLLGVLNSKTSNFIYPSVIETYLPEKTPIPTGLIFKDGSGTQVTLVLADKSIIKPPPVIKNFPKFELTVTLDEEFIASFVKAKNALPEAETFAVTSNGINNSVDIIVGYSSKNTNRVRLTTSSAEIFEVDHINFSAKYLKDILLSNKDAKEATLFISSKGLIKTTFSVDGIESTYYLVKIS